MVDFVRRQYLQMYKLCPPYQKKIQLKVINNVNNNYVKNEQNPTVSKA